MKIIMKRHINLQFTKTKFSTDDLKNVPDNVK